MTDPDDRLAGELRALGRSLVVPSPPEDLPARVLSRLAAQPAARGTVARVRAWLRRSRRRVAVVVVLVLLLALALTPPVRAAIASWLRIGGVVVRTAPPPPGSATPQPPPAGTATSLTEARRLVGFPVAVPAALGEPDRVAVSPDRRVVGMDWGTGTRRLHLDQFDGSLDWVFVKQSWTDLVPVQISGRDGLWFPAPHRIVYVDAAGREHSERARLAGKTLVWESAPVGSPTRPTTLRLEGSLDRERAVTIAESVR